MNEVPEEATEIKEEVRERVASAKDILLGKFKGVKNWLVEKGHEL